MTEISELPPTLERLRSALLPLLDQQPAVMDEHLGLSLSAVLVLLVPRGDDFGFFLTARPDDLARHPGQISLPGGAMEAHDRSLWDTAVRETEEELGVPRDAVMPLGQLEPIPVSVSQYLIAPFVGWSREPLELRPDPREVAEVMEVPLAELTRTDSVVTEPWQLRGATWDVTFYRFGETVVWGATARILGQLASRLEPRLAEMQPAPGSVSPA